MPLDEHPYPFGPLAKLLFLTAQRRQEVAEMHCDEIEDVLDYSRKTLQNEVSHVGLHSQEPCETQPHQHSSSLRD